VWCGEGAVRRVGRTRLTLELWGLLRAGVTMAKMVKVLKVLNV